MAVSSQQKLVVVVVGDTKQFEQSLTRASGKTESFSKGLGKSAGGARAELLAMAKQAGDSARASKTWMDERNRQLAETEKQSGLAGLASSGLAVRFGLVTAGAVAGAQALSEASKALEVTGTKAGTTEGRIRNLGSALLRGDVVGGIQALAKESGLSSDQLDRLAQNSQKAGNQVEIDGLKAAAAAAGFSQLASDLNKASAAANALAAQQALDFSQRGEQIIDTPAGPVAITKGTSPNDLGRMQGPGGTVGIPTFNGSDLNPPRRRGITVEQRNAWFDAGIARFLDQARDVPTLQGQIAALNKIETLISQRIAITKDITRKLKLEDQIRGIERQKSSLAGQIAANVAQAKADAATAAKQKKALEQQQRALARAALIAREFRMLGLGPDGNPATPSVANLRKRIGTFESNVQGTFLDTKKTQAQLSRFRKVLAQAVVPEEIRAKIDDLLLGLGRQLRSGLDKLGKTGGPLTKTTQLSDRILDGLGLGRDQERILRARLSHFNSAGVALKGSGSGSVNVTVQAPDIYMDGAKVTKGVSKTQKRLRKVNTSQRNGPNQGLTVA